MSTYTNVSKKLVDLLVQNGHAYTSMRMRDIFVEVSNEDYYAAMDAGIPIDQFYVTGQEQYAVLIVDVYDQYPVILEMFPEGDAWSYSTGQSVLLVERITDAYGNKTYLEQMFHDGPCRWHHGKWIDEEEFRGIVEAKPYDDYEDDYDYDDDDDVDRYGSDGRHIEGYEGDEK